MAHRGSDCQATARARDMMRRSREGQAEVSRAMHALLTPWGCAGLRPVGAARLRQMMAEQGVREEDNAFSREIVAMREE